MGIYNNIHDINDNDDLYYYCPVNDCPCHQPDYYDSSRNNYNNYYFFNYDNDGPSDDNIHNNNDCASDNNFCGELN
jgi:hypothetical protein